MVNKVNRSGQTQSGDLKSDKRYYTSIYNFYFKKEIHVEYLCDLLCHIYKIYPHMISKVDLIRYRKRQMKLLYCYRSHLVLFIHSTFTFVYYARLDQLSTLYCNR